MTKEFRALERIENILKANFHHYKQDVGYIKEALVKSQEQKKVIEIISKKGFDEDIKDYDSYANWVEYKVEQFAKAIDDNPTILNWDMFDNFTYTQEEFDLLKRCIYGA